MKTQIDAHQIPTWLAVISLSIVITLFPIAKRHFAKVQCVNSNDAKTDFMSTHPSKSASKTLSYAVALTVYDA